MADSNMVKLSKKYGLADQISQMRNFQRIYGLGKEDASERVASQAIYTHGRG